MIYCSECLQPDTRPSETLIDGVCSACRAYIAIEEQTVDWDQRERIFEQIKVDFASDSGPHDCILGVSGGKDSLRQALWLRDVAKMRPLLVSLVYPPEQMTEAGEANLNNIIAHGFDLQFISPKPQVWKRLMRAGFEEYGNWARSTEMALYSAVPKVAIFNDISLIFTGENQSLRDPNTLADKPWDYNLAVNQNTLNNGNINWMHEVDGVAANDLPLYRYPERNDFVEKRLQIVDLGWFIKNWNNMANARFAVANGLTIRQQSVETTGDPFGVSALDDDWVAVNQMIKYLKFGYGKATDYMNEDIRERRRTRREAIQFVEEYDGVCGQQYIDSFCAYLEMSEKHFWDVVARYANMSLFEQRGHSEFFPRFTVGVGLDR